MYSVIPCSLDQINYWSCSYDCIFAAFVGRLVLSLGITQILKVQLSEPGPNFSRFLSGLINKCLSRPFQSRFVSYEHKCVAEFVLTRHRGSSGTGRDCCPGCGPDCTSRRSTATGSGGPDLNITRMKC